MSGWALGLVLLSLWGMGPVAQSTRGLWEPCQAVHVQFCLVVEVGVQLQPDLCLKGGQRGEALPKVTQLEERHACVRACVHVCPCAVYMYRLSTGASYPQTERIKRQSLPWTEKQNAIHPQRCPHGSSHSLLPHHVRTVTSHRALPVCQAF